MFFISQFGGPKAIISVENLNAMFQTDKIQHAHGLQITYNTDGQRRNLFVYHESGKVSTTKVFVVQKYILAERL